MQEITICLKEYIDEEDFKKLQDLENLCKEKEEMYLKLELDFKLSAAQTCKEQKQKDINEFFCYCGKEVIGYIGICNFGGEAGELTGMIHPDYRRRGLFTRLYVLAKEECIRRGLKSVLLVCDHKALSGQKFIKAIGAKYSFSEYEMKLGNIDDLQEGKSLVLRKARNIDAEEIGRQNSIYFGVDGRTVILPEEEEVRGRITYMIELDTQVIGKIRVGLDESEGFISAFGILPEYRAKGYGREALRAALYIIKKNGIQKAALSVAANNKNALNLYKSCGFEEQSVMDYYECCQ